MADNDIDDKHFFKRSAMVLFAIEQSLGGYVRENVSELNELPPDQTKKFVEGPSKVQTVEGLIQETYVGEILDIAISAANLVSDQAHLRRLKSLADCLELYDIRNAVAHPNRPFPECYWHRLAAIATDPVVDILGFNTIKRAFDSANANKITLPPDEWFAVYAFTLPNNLPTTLDHEITGLIGREKEKRELLKKLKSKRFGLIALVGPGGTGKTAIALDLLRDAVLDPKTYEWADEIVFVTAKTERLTKDGTVSIVNPIASLDDAKESIARELAASHELNDAGSFDAVAKQLCDRKVFLCLDNLETLLRDHPGPFDDFYASLPDQWRLLVTSRVPVDSATNVAITPMDAGAAGALARNYLAKRGGQSLEAAVFEQLVDKTDRNPLAIRISIDGIIAGLDVATALAQTRENILVFSYTSLLKHLPAISNQVLECLFAANQRLTRTEIRALLDSDSDQVALGVQALLRTSLIVRHSDENVESYSLNSSIRDLLLRYPLDDGARTSVFKRLAERQSTILQIQSQVEADPLDRDYIPSSFPAAIALQTFRAFQMVRRKEPKACMADQLDQLRGDLHAHNEPALYRAIASLLLELNDRDSARQMLEQALSRNAVDSSARLMLAELYKNENRLKECFETSKPLRDERWFDDQKVDRVNLARLARVTWLVGIWLDHTWEEIKYVSDWKETPDLRAIKGTIYCTALRRLLEPEHDKDKANSYIREMIECLDEILRIDGYGGSVILESGEAMKGIFRKIMKITLQADAAQAAVKFVDAHLVAICNARRELSIDDDELHQFIDLLKSQASQYGVSVMDNLRLQTIEDPILSKYGYVPVVIYAPPIDAYGFSRSFLFAKDAEGVQYHVSRRVTQDASRFDELEKGDQLLVLPRDEYEEGKARPVKDAIIV